MVQDIVSFFGINFVRPITFNVFTFLFLFHFYIDKFLARSCWFMIVEYSYNQCTKFYDKRIIWIYHFLLPCVDNICLREMLTSALGHWLVIHLKKVFMGNEKKVINILTTFFISHKNGIKVTFGFSWNVCVCLFPNFFFTRFWDLWLLFNE